ncbi:hypothetical protein H072_3920 [Dactylellina haptotyla CBS 200.50]|uniref:Peptide hydrolase n=1 Tax=Dactylellina haptotyla (strain CBS 200.50) TaxID=1284197 RepID=S8BRI7_DACHA|nr:hypothetical protein H072_3920 [Dactylellina haptotyla CBS 200.50]
MVRIMKADSSLTLACSLLAAFSFVTSVSAWNKLSDAGLKKIPSPGDTLNPDLGKLLKPLLIPRVVNTEGSRKALQHFTNFFTDLKWSLNYDNFSMPTALSSDPVPFSNFWATLDPPWKQGENQEGEIGRLVLVAHYDSKIEPAGFIGATDSAAPCAMIMHIAKSIDKAMRRKWEKMQKDGDEFEMADEQGLMVLLLDGEEAFKWWTSTDSIYGARHLAEKWETTMHAAHSTYKNHLSSINLFVLLDLLGAPVPRVPSYFRTTHWAYQHMADLEIRLRALELLESGKDHALFLPDRDKTEFAEGLMIEDDHIPFLRKGVDILHLIASPFPSVWHTMEDDGKHLDKQVVNDWAIIVSAFVAEWYGLEPYLADNGDGMSTISKRGNKTEL